MKKYTKEDAHAIIAFLASLPSTSITEVDFEDGSGWKFNCKIEGHDHFVDLHKARVDIDQMVVDSPDPKSFLVKMSKDRKTLSPYNIFHCKRNFLLPFDARQKVDREYAGTIWAESLEDAFKSSQNDINPEWAKLGNRSTSVGDVITAPDGKFYYVKGTGFELIP